MAINNTRAFIKPFELMTLNIYCIASHCTVDQSNSMHASLLGKLYTKNIHKSRPFIILHYLNIMRSCENTACLFLDSVFSLVSIWKQTSSAMQSLSGSSPTIRRITMKPSDHLFHRAAIATLHLVQLPWYVWRLFASNDWIT